MRNTTTISFAVAIAVFIIWGLVLGGIPTRARSSGKAYGDAADTYAQQLLKDGRQIFRFDTFGSEDFWGGQLKLHQAIQGEKLGGVGPGVSPKKALELGLKVDMTAIPKRSLQPSRPAKWT